MVHLRGEIISSQFGEYKYTHETGTKPESILYWVRDSTAIFKKEISLWIKFNLTINDDVSRTDVVVGGDHGQGTFRFPMKLLFVMKFAKHI